MSKLRALEKEANELALILDQALLSQSIDVKKEHYLNLKIQN